MVYKYFTMFYSSRKLHWRSELNKETLEKKNLEYKCLIQEEKIEQLQKENCKLKELMENMKPVNSGWIKYDSERHAVYDIPQYMIYS